MIAINLSRSFSILNNGLTKLRIFGHSGYRYSRASRRNAIRGIIVTAAAADRHSGYDFVSRYFAPEGGIPEDPVTGSAHTALAPYWSHRLGRDALTGLQVSERTGLVRTAVRGDRVYLTGQAVTVFDGTLDHNASL